MESGFESKSLLSKTESMQDIFNEVGSVKPRAVFFDYICIATKTQVPGDFDFPSTLYISIQDHQDNSVQSAIFFELIFYTLDIKYHVADCP